MRQGSISASQHAAPVQEVVWVVGSAAYALIVSQLCILVGALFAMVLEQGAARPVSIAMNALAFGFMVASYAVLLTLTIRFLSRRALLRPAIWVGLLIYPLVWAALMLSAGDGRYAPTPLIVGLTGVAAAWAATQRARSDEGRESR